MSISSKILEKLHAFDINDEKEPEKWSGDVKTKWHPPEGTFEKSGKGIAKTLLAGGKKKALKRLAFYRNRAGDNLSPADNARLDAAEGHINRKMAKKAAKKAAKKQ